MVARDDGSEVMIVRPAVKRNAARLAPLLMSFPFLYFGGVRGVDWCAAAGMVLALCSAASCIAGAAKADRNRPGAG